MDRDEKNVSTAKADRKRAMDKISTEAADWAKSNNIDAKWLMPGGRGMGAQGPGGMGGRHGDMGQEGEADDDAATPAATPAS